MKSWTFRALHHTIRDAHEYVVEAHHSETARNEGVSMSQLNSTMWWEWWERMWVLKLEQTWVLCIHEIGEMTWISQIDLEVLSIYLVYFTHVAVLNQCVCVSSPPKKQTGFNGRAGKKMLYFFEFFLSWWNVIKNRPASHWLLDSLVLAVG